MKNREERPPLAQRLRDSARAADLTSEALAQKLGVSASAVRVWWTGRNEPTVAVLAAYAQLVGVTLEWLVAGKVTAESGVVSSMDALPLLLTMPEVAAVLRVGSNEPYEMVKRGQLYAIKLGKRLLVPKKELERLLALPDHPSSPT